MGEKKMKTLAPRPGRGLFTSWSRFSMGDFEDSFAGWRDVIIKDNAWRQIPGTVATTLPTGGGLGTGAVWGIYYYNAIDTANSAAIPSTTLIAQVGGGPAIVGRYDTNTAILSTEFPFETNFKTIKNRLFIAGCLSTGELPTIVTKYPSATQYDWGIPEPSAELAHTPYTGLPAGNSPEVGIYINDGTTGDGVETDGTINLGSPTIVDAPPGGLAPAVAGQWDGKTIIINNDPTMTYTINTIVDPENGTLTTTAVAAGPDAPFEIHYGALSWSGTVQPKYAYSYYNPTTGHSSSISPVHVISEKDMTNVKVEITDIPLTNDPNYTHVILWRSPLEGGGLVEPLKLDPGHGGSAVIETVGPDNALYMIQNTGPGTATYIDNQPDSQLKQIVGDFAGPTDNVPPPADIKFMEYWDGRVFCNTVSAPWRIRFSKRSGEGLGVGEESFPETNFFDISAEDGICTGMRVVGGSLLLATDRYLYSVPTNYASGGQPDRVSSRGAGVTHWAIDEHPGDTSGNSASAIYIGRDKRLWRQYPGGRLEDIGAPIQDKLDRGNLGISKPYIVRVFSRLRNWFCAVGIGRADARYDFYFFDLDALAWMNFGFTDGVFKGMSIGTGIEFTTGVGSAYAHIGRDSANQIYPLFETSIATSTASVLTTQSMDFGDITTKKTLQEVVFYVDDASANYACSVRFDGSTGAYTSMSEFDPASSPRYRGPGIIRFDVKNISTIQWHSAQFQFTLAGAAAFSIGALFRVEMVISIESTGASGRPS